LGNRAAGNVDEEMMYAINTGIYRKQASTTSKAHFTRFFDARRSLVTAEGERRFLLCWALFVFYCWWALFGNRARRERETAKRATIFVLRERERDVYY